MQTFIPVTTSFEDMAKILDNKRLNKQALEGWQILMVLTKLNPDGTPRTVKGWANHPAAKMWQGYETALFHYIESMVVEWKARGYKSTIGDKARETIRFAELLGTVKEPATHEEYLPAWIRDTDVYEKVAASHRLALLNKDYNWYSQFGWQEDTGTRPDSYTYIWPSVDGSYVVGEPRNTEVRVPTA
jgi:hypothetical protein